MENILLVLVIMIMVLISTNIKKRIRGKMENIQKEMCRLGNYIIYLEKYKYDCRSNYEKIINTKKELSILRESYNDYSMYLYDMKIFKI